MKKNNTPLSYALFLLGRRDYAKSEIFEKLQKRYNLEEAQECLQILVEKKFLDDDRFVKTFIANHRSKGKFYIRQKLNLLKIDTKLIEERLSEISDSEELEKAKGLAEKYLSQKGQGKNWYEKTGSFLVRRGFSYDIVKKALQNILNDNQ